MPNVIAPAWKPYGHRQTIVPTVAQKKVAKQEQPDCDDEDYCPYESILHLISCHR